MSQLWTDEQLEEAYMTWAYKLSHNLTHTAEETGIPLRTLAYHKRNAKWDERYAAETAEIAGLAFEYGLNELRLGISAAALQLVKDSSDNTLEHAQRLASQRLLFSMMIGGAGPEHAGPTHVSLIDARQVQLPPNNDHPSLVSSRAIEANISRAIDAQSRSRRK